MKNAQEQRGPHTEDALQVLFRAVLKMHKRCLRKEMDRRGLTEVGQPGILFMLHNHAHNQKLDQKQFAEALGVSPATVAVSIKRMERAGLVCKAPDPEDLRRNCIAITDKGSHIIDDCIQAFQHVDTGTLKGFSKEERKLLEGYYRRMMENLVAMGAQLPTFIQQEGEK